MNGLNNGVGDDLRVKLQDLFNRQLSLFCWKSWGDVGGEVFQEKYREGRVDSLMEVVIRINYKEVFMLEEFQGSSGCRGQKVEG